MKEATSNNKNTKRLEHQFEAACNIKIKKVLKQLVFRGSLDILMKRKEKK